MHAPITWHVIGETAKALLDGDEPLRFRFAKLGACPAGVFVESGYHSPSSHWYTEL